MLLLELVQAQKDPTVGQEEKQTEQNEHNRGGPATPACPCLYTSRPAFSFFVSTCVGVLKITVFFPLYTKRGDMSRCDLGSGGVLVCLFAPCLFGTSFVSGGTASHRHGLILRNLQSGKGDKC